MLCFRGVIGSIFLRENFHESLNKTDQSHCRHRDAIRKELLEHFSKLGITGFTCMNCWGQGHHAVYQEPFMGHSQLRIEVITNEEIADAIVEYCSQPRFDTHAVIVYLETVNVANPNKFLPRT